MSEMKEGVISQILACHMKNNSAVNVALPMKNSE
jgi:hypothetical protein